MEVEKAKHYDLDLICERPSDLAPDYEPSKELRPMLSEMAKILVIGKLIYSFYIIVLQELEGLAVKS